MGQYHKLSVESVGQRVENRWFSANYIVFEIFQLVHFRYKYPAMKHCNTSNHYNSIGSTKHLKEQEAQRMSQKASSSSGPQTALTSDVGIAVTGCSCITGHVMRRTGSSWWWRYWSLAVFLVANVGRHTLTAQPAVDQLTGDRNGRDRRRNVVGCIIAWCDCALQMVSI